MVLQKHSFLKFILLQLIYNVKFCCTASDSVIHICTFFFIFLYIMAYPRILNTVSCTIQLILHSQSFSPSPTLLGNHRSVLQKPLMFPLQDKKLEFCPKMQSWCSIREGMFKHWICKYTNTSWPKCRGESKGKTPYEAWEFSATGFSTAVTQKQTKKKQLWNAKAIFSHYFAKRFQSFPGPRRPVYDQDRLRRDSFLPCRHPWPTDTCCVSVWWLGEKRQAHFLLTKRTWMGSPGIRSPWVFAWTVLVQGDVLISKCWSS